MSWSDDMGVESKSAELVRLIPKSSERSRSPKGIWTEFRQSMPKPADLCILTQLLTGSWMVTQTSEALALSVPRDMSASTELSSSVPASCSRSAPQQQMQCFSRSHSAKKGYCRLLPSFEIQPVQGCCCSSAVLIQPPRVRMLPPGL